MKNTTLKLNDAEVIESLQKIQAHVKNQTGMKVSLQQIVSFLVKQYEESQND
jgi:hypothetical protein|tara:strand:- start:19409 stop:19564 length:156 start_codon:yes stop_codon:yes gene_type:complete